MKRQNNVREGVVNLYLLKARFKYLPAVDGVQKPLSGIKHEHIFKINLLH